MHEQVCDLEAYHVLINNSNVFLSSMELCCSRALG
jgi:hypothetical protein